MKKRSRIYQYQFAYVREYVDKLEAEVVKICVDIFTLMDEILIISTRSGEIQNVSVILQRQLSMIQKKRKIVKIPQKRRDRCCVC